MKIKSSLVLSLLCLFSFFIQANNYTVKGIVIDSVSSESIPFATVSASSLEAPQVYLKRVAADLNGAFELPIAQQGDYIIHFESIGMENLYELITIWNETSYDMGIVKMKPSEELLSELVVTAAKPLVHMDMDKIIYDTKSDPESQSSNVLEMLRKVPMVTVDGEDNIQVKGSSNFKVYMNGKPSNMTASNPSQVLKSIPANTIKSIEVITEPGSKYDAEGVGGIINIVTEKTLVGYTGSAYVAAETIDRYYGGLYFSTKIGKFGLTANLIYSYSEDNTRKNNSDLVNENPGANDYKYLYQYSGMDYKYNYYYLNMEASYEFDSLNLVSFSLGGNRGNNKYNTEGFTNMLFENLDTLSYYRRNTNSKSIWGGMDMNVDYQRSFTKPDKLLTLSYRLGMTPDESQNEFLINGVKNYESSRQFISTDGKSREHTFQLDYTEPFNKKHIVEGGIKYILRLNSSDNVYQIWDNVNGHYIENPLRDNDDFEQRQHIVGAYGSYTLKLDKFSVRAGARYEYTESNVEFDNNDNNFNAYFSNFVPSVLLSYRPTMMSNITLAYGQRISRPGIDYLNPYVNNTNPNFIRYGNPKLDPEVSHSFSLSYGMFSSKLSMNTAVFTQFTNKSIAEVTRLENGVVYTTYENIGHNNISGANLYLNYAPIPILRIYAEGSFYYLYYKSDNAKNDGIRYNGTGGVQLTLPWNLFVNAYGGYYSPWVSLEGEGSSFHYTGFSLGRSFFKKKLDITLRASDPFTKYKNYNYFVEKEGAYRTDTKQRMRGRSFALIISYSFGEMKEQIKKASRGITNDDLKSGGQGENQGGAQKSN